MGHNLHTKLQTNYSGCFLRCGDNAVKVRWAIFQSVGANHLWLQKWKDNLNQIRSNKVIAKTVDPVLLDSYYGYTIVDATGNM